MKYEETILAFQECKFKLDPEICSKCPYLEKGCFDEMKKDIVEIYNRQKDLIKRQEAYIERCESGEEDWVKRLMERPRTVVKNLGEQIKMAFYYEFDELIPSIMADKIDELVREYGGNVQ